MTHYQEDADRAGNQDEASREFECDFPDCKAVFEGEGTFQNIWADAKNEGWRCFKNKKDAWEHRCPDHIGQ